jgi:hypothetical protein
MGGGLMQLVAYGAQDVFLTGNPQISFFKVVYRRHTNFAMESIAQTFNGSVGYGNKVSTTISRNGDLVTNMWLEVLVSDTGNCCNSFGHSLIDYVELEIGGQRIDKHYGEWMEIWSELTLPEEKRQGFKEMIGRRDAYSSEIPCPVIDNNTLYIPLQFFFCRNPGLALPLIALQYHEVKINVQFRGKDAMQSLTSAAGLPPSFSCSLYVDYVYLDTEERRRFAQMTHEYLIEQLQFTGVETGESKNVRLNFNHPVKELVWVYRSQYNEPMNFRNNSTATLSNKEGGNYIGYGNISENNAWIDPSFDADDWFEKCKLQLNGHDRFSERGSSYFRLVQPYQHHTRVPSKNVYVYSFGLNPEAHQPSGTCNFSRLDNVTLQFTGTKGLAADTLLVYAVNYNVLRIMSGMGGLAYSN